MRCEEFEAIVFSGTAPDEAQQALMQAHAKGCEACRVLLENADVLDGSRTLDEQMEPSARFCAGWRRAVREAPQQSGLRARAARWLSALKEKPLLRGRPAVRVAAYALCAVALLGVGAGLGRMPDAHSVSMVYGADNGTTLMKRSVSYDGDFVMMSGADTADYEYAEETRADMAAAGAAVERKIIRTAQMEIQTDAFDAALEAIRARTAQAGGQVTYCNVRMMGEQHIADMTLSVPQERLDDFLAGASELGEVVQRMDSADDMTAQYQDTASRLESARAQKAQLDALYAKAEDMEDIIAITDALFDVQQQIDSLEGSNRWIDDRADNAQVSITLNEMPQEGEGFFARLGGSFAGGFAAIGSVVSGIVMAAAWLLPWAAIAGVMGLAVYGVRRWLRGRKG